jgi:predicted DNA-binding transcriptional regulator AlpA
VKREPAHVRGIVAERVVLSTELDPFLSLKALATYSGLGVRTLRARLTDPRHPLPCYRIGGKIVVRRSEFDAWVAQFKTVGNPNVEHVVAEVLADLGGLQRRN